jgi:2-C-methyl-D-erythritol 4-phosphate cytidylyltransferase/2-C-methyl-D-erythritol 2,4-cyclodiphosphate synthase
VNAANGVANSNGTAVGVIVVAAGSGTRLGRDVPKAFVDVGGRSILERSIRTVFTLAEPCRVVVVAPADRLDEATAIASKAAGVAIDSITVVAGGSTRQESVAAGIAALTPDIDVVLVHDCARAFTPVAQFEAVIAAVRATGGGVIPGLAITDTIKTVDAAATVTATARVTGTLDRSALIAVQTPQGFPRAALEKAYESAADDHTDDAALFAAAGHPVSSIAGDPLAFKITTPWDLQRAELLSEGHSSRKALVRTGVGIDVHAFDAESPLWLGGLFFADEPGLAGHSDGDAVSHAICDALLSAAGLGDIGGTFGTDDPRFVNARGDVFLTATVALLAQAGFEVSNVAVQVIAKRPKLAPRRTEMERALTALVGAPVSVSATTTDGLGFTGRGEGVCAIATALISSAPTPAPTPAPTLAPMPAAAGIHDGSATFAVTQPAES